MLNNDQIMSAVRWVLTTVGTYLVAKGTLSSADSASAQADVLVVVGALLPLIALVWSFFKHAEPKPVPPPPPPLSRSGRS